MIWTDEEISILEEKYGKVKGSEIKTMIPRHSLNAIFNAAYNHGLTKRTVSVKRLSDIERGWIAGLVDGEGTLTIRRLKTKFGFGYHPRLMLGNTDHQLIEKIKLVIGSGHVSSYKFDNKKHKDFWCFELSTGPLEQLLSQISKLLIVKRMQAEILFNVIAINKRHHGGYRNYLTDEERLEMEKFTANIRKLNTRGKRFKISI
jgi:hypothetical protein